MEEQTARTSIGKACISVADIAIPFAMAAFQDVKIGSLWRSKL